MAKRILLVGTLDTKGDEYAFAGDLIVARGHNSLLMDVGVAGEATCDADIVAAEVAEAGGSSLEALRAQGDRNAALEVMMRGAVTLAAEHVSTVDGVLALGGSGGTAVGTAVMRSLRVGLPKLMLSTLASGDVGPYVGESDIAMMYSVADIAGLNRISRQIIANAVGAICGMVEQALPPDKDKPIVAATMFGVTTPCVTRLRARLEAAGYEVVVFHATGSGGRAMEKLIRSGFFAGVADVTTTEWCDEIVGGVLSAGPERLTAAAESSVPQVVSCGALDMVNFWALDTVPDRFRARTLHAHNANVTLMRTNAEECAHIGKAISERLSRASGPVTLVFPLRGVSAIDAKGQPFFAPDANAALFDALRRHAGQNVKIDALDLHINDNAFADALATHLIELL